MRVGEDAKRLHAVDLVGDRKPVEAKKRVGYLCHCFDTSGVRAAVYDLEEIKAVFSHIPVRQTEERPYPTHS